MTNLEIIIITRGVLKNSIIGNFKAIPIGIAFLFLFLY